MKYTAILTVPQSVLDALDGTPGLRERLQKDLAKAIDEAIQVHLIRELGIGTASRVGTLADVTVEKACDCRITHLPTCPYAVPW
jgi:hypothetical protein